MRENRKSSSMSGDGKRSRGTMEERQRRVRAEAETEGLWLPRPSLTLPFSRPYKKIDTAYSQ